MSCVQLRVSPYGYVAGIMSHVAVPMSFLSEKRLLASLVRGFGAHSRSPLKTSGGKSDRDPATSGSIPSPELMQIWG